jgi:hypothetical protein
MIKAYEVYYCDYEMSDDPFHVSDLEITYDKRERRIKVHLDLNRWANCDSIAAHLEWAADQILKFKDLKGLENNVQN